MIYLVTRVLKKFLWDFAGTFLVMEVRKQMHISLKPKAACKPQMWTSGLWCEIWGLNVLFRRQQSQGLPLLSYYRCCVVHIFIKYRLLRYCCCIAYRCLKYTRHISSSCSCNKNKCKLKNLYIKK